MIRVVAIITAKPGRRDEALAALHETVPAVRAEPGCIDYTPTVDADGFGAFQTKLGPDVYVVVEAWESADALKAHAVAPHMAALGKKTKDLIANVAVHVLTPD